MARYRQIITARSMLRDVQHRWEVSRNQPNTSTLVDVLVFCGVDQVLQRMWQSRLIVEIQGVIGEPGAVRKD